MNSMQHSVTLDRDKCMGCTNCIAHCPTEAIRVRHGKAFIIEERCIDCGECIRVCPHHAKKAHSDTLTDLQKFAFTVAIPAPTLYGQFEDKYSIDRILTALKKIGFDAIFEAAEAADIVAAKLQSMLKAKTEPLPWISSSCPAIVRLIQRRFPSLLDQVVRIESPMEVAARIVKKRSTPTKKISAFFSSAHVQPRSLRCGILSVQKPQPLTGSLPSTKSSSHSRPLQAVLPRWNCLAKPRLEE